MSMKIFYHHGTHVITPNKVHLLFDPSITTNEEMEYSEYEKKRRIEKKRKNPSYEDVDLLLISHAHADHTDNVDYFKHLNKPYICHPITYQIRRNWLPGVQYAQFMGTEKNLKNVLHFENIKIECFSSGHCSGSLMFKITENETSLLFTGDLNTQQQFIVDSAQPVSCDYLIIEGTFGDKAYTFPFARDCYKEIRSYLMQKFQTEGYRCVLIFGQGLGKNQNLAFYLNNLQPFTCFDSLGNPEKHKLTLIMGKQTYNYTQAHNTFFKNTYKLIDPIINESSFYEFLIPRCTVFLFTIGLYCNLSYIEKIKKRYGLYRNERDLSYELPILIISGWKNQHVQSISNCYHTAKSIQMSSHADFPSLLTFVKKCNPKHVFVFHGHSKQFVRELKKRGIDAHDLHTSIEKKNQSKAY